MCLPLKERLVFLGECPPPNLTAVVAPLDSAHGLSPPLGRNQRLVAIVVLTPPLGHPLGELLGSGSPLKPSLRSPRPSGGWGLLPLCSSSCPSANFSFRFFCKGAELG